VIAEVDEMLTEFVVCGSGWCNKEIDVVSLNF
jgi:hypothetical protein